MYMFAETCGNKQGKKTISTYENVGAICNRLLNVQQVKRFDTQAHREAVICAIKHLCDVNLGMKSLAVTATGKKLAAQHYGWILVITRRTTRTRA